METPTDPDPGTQLFLVHIEKAAEESLCSSLMNLHIFLVTHLPAWRQALAGWSSEALFCFRACFILTFYLWPGTRASHVRQ